jgi:hypothetical protein
MAAGSSGLRGGLRPSMLLLALKRDSSEFIRLSLHIDVRTVSRGDDDNSGFEEGSIRGPVRCPGIGVVSRGCAREELDD